MRIRPHLDYLTLFLVLAQPVSAMPASGGESSPDVLLITVDTLRPDALGWVAGLNATPVLDELANQGFRFPAAVSPAPVTQPSHASLFTAMTPRRHGVRDNGRVLGSSPPTLAELLGRHGYMTAAFVSGYPLAAEFGLDRGFDHYDDELGGGAAGRLERPAPQTAAAALEWLAGVDEDRPWFVWIHFWDPHDPYTPPAKFRRDGPRGAYHGEVAFVDHTVGELRRGLDKHTDRLLTIFTADHGESLGEHGENTHGFFIYDSTIAVPLVFHYPGQITPGDSSAPVRLVDVAPTVLELLGLPPLRAADVDGRSLVPWFGGPASRPRDLPPALIETRRPWLSYGWSPLRAVRQGDWKLIAAPRPELYDLSSDPGETRNLVRDERARARQLRDVLLEIEALPVAGSQSLEDPETMAKLRSLGYVGAGSDPGEPPPGVADPKDRVEQWNALSEAQALMERGELRQAVAAFDAVLKTDPRNPFALSRSGAALLSVGDVAAAAPRLRRAAEVQPDDAETRSALATALTRLGDYGAASEQWFELVRLRPRQAEGWINLAVTLGRSGKTTEATGALARAVELAPERADLRVRLALAHHAGGDVQAAKAALRGALAVAPEWRPRIEADPVLSGLLE